MASWQGFIVDLVAGTIGGSAGIAVGQPFDVIKVRLQHDSSWRGPWHCLSGTVTNEGYRGLYRGMTPPLCIGAAVNAIVFTSYGTTLRILHNISPPDANSPITTPSLWHVGIAGAVAGFAQTLVLAPADFVKCQLQIQHGSSSGSGGDRGAMTIIRDTIRTDGVKGIFRGFSSTLMREIPGYGLYFGSYEGVKKLLTPRDEAPSAVAMLAAGGFAGALGWLVVYPVDVLKTVIQTLPSNTSLEEQSMRYQFRRIAKQHGYRYFLRGLGTTLFRAFPVNGVTFLVYENITQSMWSAMHIHF
eukprot:c8637_g1_i1.p1 GENE.c8637_g1_i1~~c8637_g1_i1.p1  ORF type:complete len:300 (-),score=34.47 c8637_g1_i1:291-1190(-)